MAHCIIELQTALVFALKNDAQLVALLGGEAIYDAPPKAKDTPFVAMVRHDVLSKDGDEAQSFEHRLLIHCWHFDASRKKVLAIVERVIKIALSADLSSVNLIVTHAQHDRSNTMIDGQSGKAKAAIALKFFSEPAV